MTEQPGLRRGNAFGRGAPHWRRLGGILTAHGVITSGQLLSALDQQADLAAAGRAYLIGRVLMSMGLASAAEIDKALDRQARHAARIATATTSIRMAVTTDARAAGE